MLLWWWKLVTLTSLYQTHLWLFPAGLSSCLLISTHRPSEKLLCCVWGYSNKASPPVQFLPCHLPAPFLPNPFHPAPGLGLGLGLHLSPHFLPLPPPTLSTSPLAGLSWEVHKYAVSLKSWSKTNSADLTWPTMVSYRSISGIDLQPPTSFLYWEWKQPQDDNDFCEKKGLR